MGRYDLRLTESEFWHSTPRAFMELVKRFNAARRHQLYCAAMPTAAVYNVHRGEDVTAITPAELIGEGGETSTERRLTSEDMKALFRGLAVPMFGGEVTTGSSK